MDLEDQLFTGTVPDGYREYLEPVIFRPWAQKLVSLVGLTEGQRVLDVAAGTGVVSREAASRVGPEGRVIASDISDAMLRHVHVGYPEGGPTVETLVCSATEIELPDASVDAVVCQQGLQFFSDRPKAVREMARVLRPGGVVGVAVWQSTARVEPLIVYGDALRANGVPEPFPGAYDTTLFSMTFEEVGDALKMAGLEDVEVSVERLQLAWPSVDHAVRGVFGTPYGPVVAALDDDARQAVLEDLELRMTGPDGRAISHGMVAVLAKGRRPLAN
jgi:SAM-dependent methyltransferase